MLAHFRVVPLGFALFALAVSGCAREKKPTTASGVVVQDLNPDMVVATYGGKKITAKELDAKAGAQLHELEMKKYQLRRQTLEDMVLRDLVEADAKKKGIDEQTWFKNEVEGKIPPVSDDELRAAYEQFKAQMPPGPEDQQKEQLRDFLSRKKRNERLREALDALKAEAKVEFVLPEPAKARVQVAFKGPSRGPDDAKVTIVEFSDFECPYCSKARETVEQVMGAYAGKVKLSFRHFPLPFHKQATKAAEASMCANEQGRFWEYHDALFQNQDKLGVDELKKQAGTLGLDAAKFGECLDSGRMTKLVQQDIEEGQQAGVNGTPAFFVNGVLLSGALPLDEFKKAIDAELATN